jgi:hypothetical protein
MVGKHMCVSQFCFNVYENCNFLGIFASWMRILNARIPDSWEFTVPVDFACHILLRLESVFSICIVVIITYSLRSIRISLLHYTKKNALTFH